MNDVVKSIWIDAPAEVVFEYFTDSEKMARWCGKTAELNPVPGGIYRLDMGEWGVVEGEFVRVEPPHFLSHTVPSAQGPDAPPSVIEISITPDAGGCRVEMRQTGLAPPLDRIAMRGLEHHLARLSVAATGGTPARDSMCTRTMESFG